MKINKVYVINLNRRPDRWRDINKYFGSVWKLNRWPAVDGRKITDLSKHIDGNYYDVSPSKLACALSHYQLWTHIVNNNEDNILILEDDAIPTKNFYKWKSIQFSDWNILFLGVLGEDNNCGQMIAKNIYRINNLYGTHAYIIRHSYARTLLNLIKYPFDIQVPIKGIDIYLHDIVKNPANKIYTVKPSLIDQSMSPSDLSGNNYPLLMYVPRNVMKTRIFDILFLTYSNGNGFTLIGLSIFFFILGLLIGWYKPSKFIYCLIVFYFIAELIAGEAQFDNFQYYQPLLGFIIGFFIGFVIK
jgi:GR25 family glycosyltransferase involved in LPS biosynthesis